MSTHAGQLLRCLLVGLSVLVSSSSLGAQPAAERPDLFMLSVGIDRYQPPTNNLSGCVNDAQGMAKVFQAQAGKQYGRVDVTTLVDADATRAKISAGLDALRAKGKAGDWHIVFLSGHGSPALHRWTFITHDRGDISDTVLLELADDLASRGRKVMVIVDACFAGQLRYSAHEVLNRYQDPKKGGIIVAVSSMPSQLSAALQAYSAFARAVEDGLLGMANLDNDGVVTLNELRRFAYNRTYELCLLRRPFPGLLVDAQDGAIDASLSMLESTPLVQVPPTAPRKVKDDGPLTAMPGLIGTWVSGGKTDDGWPSAAPAQTFRLKLAANGVYRATLNQGSRVVRSGEGIFKPTTKTLQLSHRQGIDRMEIRSLANDQLQFRFQGRDITLHREAAPKGSVADSSWSGSESLAGFGKIAFQLDGDGTAVMIDAKRTVKGNWTQSAEQVTITFSNCVYQGTLQGQVLSGSARFTMGGNTTWTFSVTRDAAPKTLAGP